MGFSQDFIDKVRDSNNIVDVLSEFTQLKRVGGRLTGLCPFPDHREKTPSFSVSEDKQVYHCFGCKRSGQIFIALKELKGLNFPEAVEYLAQRAGIPLPVDERRASSDDGQRERKEKLLRINKIAAQFFHSQLLKQEAQHYAKAYCKKRKLSPDIVKQFQIGFAENEWESLTKKLQSLNAPFDLAIELGLVKKRKDSEGCFDLFRDRLMFPIFSHKGDCVGFGGRTLNDEQMPKYLNSSDSVLFSKGQTLYGLNETGKHIRSEDFVVVVEGYMDFLALYSAGIKNVVATLGTALTPQHANLIKRYSNKVTVLFDGDEAGQNAARRSLPILLGQELLPRAVFLPDELDPDEYIETKGSQSLNEKIKYAPDLFSVVLDQQLMSYRGSAADKIVLLDSVSEYLLAVRDPRLRDLYVSEIAQKIGVQASWVIKHLQNSSQRANRAENRHTDQQITAQMPKDVIEIGVKIDLTGASKAELFLLNISLINENRFKTIWSAQVIDQLEHSGVKEMFHQAESHYRQMPNEFAKLSAYLMTLTETPKFLGLHMGEPIVTLDEQGLDKLMNDSICQVKERHLRNQSRQLTANLKTIPTEQREEQLEQIMNIQKSKITLRRDRES